MPQPLALEACVTDGRTPRSLYAARALLALLALVPACRQADRPSPAPGAAEGPWFVDLAEDAGLRFVHFNGMSGAFYFPEVMPPGVALLDYDNDGDLDVYLVQGQMLGGKPVGDAVVPPAMPLPLTGRLFRNDLDRGAGLRFTDVTGASGLDARGYGMGAAAGDIDNDGCVDLYLTNLGANQLYRNNCDGTFTDVTARAGVASPGWSVSAAFVDADRDGWLDLFVAHYVSYRIEANIICSSVSGQPDYCPPQVYRPEPSQFYRNNGDGTFTNRTAAAGFIEFGPALGVSTADFDGDGWMDIYVANDGAPNHLWINQRDGTFRNAGMLAGAAVSAEGAAKASMGVDAGDFDEDGDEDLFVTELTGEGADLFVNDGTGVFSEQAAAFGLRVPTLPFTGFGTAWFDADNDGRLDLATVNGAVTHTSEALARGERFALHQRKQLFLNTGRRFEDATARAGPAFQVADVSRGAAFGDIDNDGDIDIVVANDAGPARLLVNQVGQRAHWVGLRLVDGGAVGGPRPAAQGRDMLGARVRVVAGGGAIRWRRARSDGSYASANDPRVLVGLASDAAPVTARVFWPDGSVEEWTGIRPGSYTTLVKGTGGSGR